MHAAVVTRKPLLEVDIGLKVRFDDAQVRMQR
jgi:hypothetical protein